MVNKKTSKLKMGLLILAIVVGLASLALLLFYMLQGKNIALFNPKGHIAYEQHKLMLTVVGIMLAVAVPAICVFFLTAWKYRESNTKVGRAVNHRSKFFVLYLWMIPLVTLTILASIMIPATHRLAPQKSLASDVKPLKIQVISLNWKWLFIYPDQGIATVNFVQIPVDTPVEFDITADESPMSSFWVPNLGGQIYTMTSHVNRLNLMADTVGDYPGSTPELNGAGFAGMRFTARVSDDQSCEQWAQTITYTPNILDADAYSELVKPSENNPVVFYSTYVDGLYDNVVTKYQGSEGHKH